MDIIPRKVEPSSTLYVPQSVSRKAFSIWLRNFSSFTGNIINFERIDCPSKYVPVSSAEMRRSKEKAHLISWKAFSIYLTQLWAYDWKRRNETKYARICEAFNVLLLPFTRSHQNEQQIASAVYFLFICNAINLVLSSSTMSLNHLTGSFCPAMRNFAICYVHWSYEIFQTKVWESGAIKCLQVCRYRI